MARRFQPAVPPRAGRPTKKGDRIQREEEVESNPSPALGYGRGGFSSKIHLLTDEQGLPLGAAISGGQRHESAFLTDVMNTVQVPQPTGRPKTRPEAVAGDKGYDAAWIRKWCLQRNIESVIPARKNTREGPGHPPTCNEQKYEDRNVIERCVGRLKECRRIATRYEKKTGHYKAMLKWAFVAEYLSR